MTQYIMGTWPRYNYKMSNLSVVIDTDFDFWYSSVFLAPDHPAVASTYVNSIPPQGKMWSQSNNGIDPKNTRASDLLWYETHRDPMGVLDATVRGSHWSGADLI